MMQIKQNEEHGGGWEMAHNFNIKVFVEPLK